MVELALGIIKTQEQRSDLPALRGVAEAADNAVRAPDLLHLQHSPLAGFVDAVAALGNNAIQRCPRLFAPLLGQRAFGGAGLEMQRSPAFGGVKGFQGFPDLRARKYGGRGYSV